MTKRMERALTHMLMELITMEIGLMISSMAGEWNLGLMVPNMKVSIRMAKKTVEENLLLLMVPSTTENLRKTRSVEAENIIGPTANTLRVNGKGTRCMAKASLLGRMVSATRVNF